MGIALDYTSRIAPSALLAAGVTDVCRYLCYEPIGSWKIIRKPEYDELIAAGIGVTLNWELGARDWAHGEATGIAHGIEAVRQAKALGHPRECTIIGSADFDMSRPTWDASGQHYCRGFAGAIRGGGYRPGVYGPWDVLGWVRDTGLIDVFWQAGMSTAWSNGRNATLWPGAQIRQRRHQTVGGQDTDRNDILIADWGQARKGRGSDVAEPTRVEWDMDALENMSEVIRGGVIAGRPMGIVSAVKAIQAKVDALALGGVSQEMLNTAIRAALADPAVLTALVEVVRQGANLAEDS